MAALPLDLPEHSILVRATDSALHNDTGVASQLLGLDGDLLSQLSGW
jgi:hypothetical protein